jgi:truncated hemoglobin YjbI
MTSLFGRLGGEAWLTRLLDLFDQQVLNDDYLGEYFQAVDIDRLKTGLAVFVGTDAASQAEAGAALRATRAGALMEFSPNSKYDYKANPF